MRVRYTCERYPELGISKVKFVNGAFETDDVALQALVESSYFYPKIKREVVGGNIVIVGEPEAVVAAVGEVVGIKPPKPKRVYRKRSK